MPEHVGGGGEPLEVPAAQPLPGSVRGAQRFVRESPLLARRMTRARVRARLHRSRGDYRAAHRRALWDRASRAASRRLVAPRLPTASRTRAIATTFRARALWRSRLSLRPFSFSRTAFVLPWASLKRTRVRITKRRFALGPWPSRSRARVRRTRRPRQGGDCSAAGQRRRRRATPRRVEPGGGRRGCEPRPWNRPQSWAVARRRAQRRRSPAGRPRDGSRRSRPSPGRQPNRCDDLAVGLDHQTVRFVVADPEADQLGAGDAEARIEAAVGQQAGDDHVVVDPRRVGLPGDEDLAVGLQRDRAAGLRRRRDRSPACRRRRSSGRAPRRADSGRRRYRRCRLAPQPRRSARPAAAPSRRGSPGRGRTSPGYRLRRRNCRRSRRD